MDAWLGHSKRTGRTGYPGTKDGDKRMSNTNSFCGLCNNTGRHPEPTIQDPHRMVHCECRRYVPLELVDCSVYVEDQCVCDDMGEPKGQCSNCGAKWYEHKLEVLPLEERESAAQLQEQLCGKTVRTCPR